jgi:hypothetical protein
MKIKTILPLRLALAGGAALLTQTSFAQTWQTVDDFHYVPGVGGGSVVAQAITKDLASNLYAAGYAIDNNDFDFAVIRKSSDGGANWTIIEAFTSGNPTNSGYEYYAITADAAGRLYAVGDDFWDATASQIGGWFVRESLDAGANWSTVDAFTLGGSSTASGVAADAAGNVYVAGSADPTNSWSSSWIVRKGTLTGSGGLSWATVDTFAPGGAGRAAGVLCHPTEGIFVVGYAYGAGRKGNQLAWYVRRSLNGGATWANVDVFLGGSAAGIGADVAGNLYVVGGNGSHWIVRKSSNGGTSWATVDDFLPARSAGATGFAADANGSLFVVGATRDWSGVYRWVVRENPGGVGGWQTVDTFQYNGGIQTVAYGAVADNSGQIFVAGFGGASWLVRKN